MKKLALALMCLVSVAFFASCTPEGQPTIQILNEEGYVQDSAVVDLNTEVKFGFVVASSPTSGKALQSLKVTVNGEEWANLTDTLAGLKEFTYRDVVTYEPDTTQKNNIVGTSVIKAIVTDEAGQTATATITLNINEPAQPLIAKTFTWVRKGANLEANTESEMAAMGLQWTNSYKEVFATIKPMANCAMYICDGNDFANITTDVEKAAYFDNLRENGTAEESYRKITTNNSADYNDLLAVIDAAGDMHLVLIDQAAIETGSFGTMITITGETK